MFSCGGSRREKTERPGSAFLIGVISFFSSMLYLLRPSPEMFLGSFRSLALGGGFFLFEIFSSFSWQLEKSISSSLTMRLSSSFATEPSSQCFSHSIREIFGWRCSRDHVVGIRITFFKDGILISPSRRFHRRRRLSVRVLWEAGYRNHHRTPHF